MIPLTFIDVVQRCLVFGTSRGKYLALSYTWGQVDMCMTLEENFKCRQHPEALATVPFPESIRDAVKLVGSFGSRLLWIDAVCIVQDDTASKARDVPNMDIIYGRAYATIVALSGDNADAGLPGVNPGTRLAQRIEHIAIKRGSSDLDYDPLGENTEIVNVVRTPRTFYLALRMSNWNTRGWIMQERLLSRRCIYFSPEAVYFQCGKSTVVDGGVNEEYKAYLRTSPTKDEHLLRKANHDNLAVLDDEHFQGSIKSTTLHGLPSGIFIHGQLWSPAGKITRRGAKFPSQRDMTTGKPDPRFPSWSWAGWDGCVEYRLFELATNVTERPVPLIRVFHLGNLKGIS